jgi:hypothetical protein
MVLKKNGGALTYLVIGYRTESNRITGWDLLETVCVSSVSFIGFCNGGNPGSGAQRRRTGRGQESPAAKAL